MDERRKDLRKGRGAPKYYCVCSANAVVLPQKQLPIPYVCMLSCCRKRPSIKRISGLFFKLVKLHSES
jgi:hypothetical protein